ncbi:MAG: tetratricopeptide repeat protein [Pirellula sp.]
MSDTYSRGFSFDQQGDYVSAEREYRAALQLDRTNSTILFRLGLCCLRLKKYELAVDLLDATATLAPESIEAWSNLGIALASLGQTTRAAIAFRRAIDLNPERADLRRNLGNCLISMGNHDEALAQIQMSLSCDPTSISALLLAAKLLAYQGRVRPSVNCLMRVLVLHRNHPQALEMLAAVRNMPSRTEEQPVLIDQESFAATLRRGLDFARRGLTQEATSEFQRATKINPESAEALVYLGSSYIELKHDQLAVECLLKALDRSPGEGSLYLNLGGANERLGKLELAIKCFQAAIQCDPKYALAYVNLSRVLASQRRLDESVRLLEVALDFSPDCHSAHYQLGVVLFIRGEAQRAVACLRHAVELDPQDANSHAMLAYALVHQGELALAIQAAENALSVNPLHESALNTLIHQSQHMCYWEKLDPLSHEATQLVRDSSRFHETNAFSEPFSPFVFVALPQGTTPKQQLECASRYLALRQASLKPANLSSSRQPKRRPIRVGYLSADFREHPVAYLIAGLFESHDRRNFEVFGYSYGEDDQSAIRNRIKQGFDCFVELKNASDLEAAEKIRADEIDILVDLTGHTRSWRPDILAHRPAPIQVHYLGYPGTTGAPYIDYLIADEYVVPPEQQPNYSERIVYLPGCFLVNDIRHRYAEYRLVRSDCNLPEGAFVFCSFNNSFKITRPIFDSWMNILKGVPSSVLWLKDPNRFAKANLIREAELRGVESSRLIFAPHCPTIQEHNARYQLADLFLDSYPYNAHTTCSDSLLGGCPVLTLAGESFSSRVAASLLQSVKLPELITTNLESYCDLAKSLAADREQLAELRKRLRFHRDASPLFKMEIFARNIEAAFQQMWRIYFSGEQPHSFHVES